MADSAKDILARLSDAPETEVYELIARYSEDPRKQVIKALESAKKRIEKEHAEKTRVEEMYRFQKELSG
ncbi:MAG: ribonuclease HII, partial [Atopobium sp.]|nr:ribonuclease HII [Atopobium sp.]